MSPSNSNGRFTSNNNSSGFLPGSQQSSHHITSHAIRHSCGIHIHVDIRCNHHYYHHYYYHHLGPILLSSIISIHYYYHPSSRSTTTTIIISVHYYYHHTLYYHHTFRLWHTDVEEHHSEGGDASEEEVHVRHTCTYMSLHSYSYNHTMHIIILLIFMLMHYEVQV